MAIFREGFEGLTATANSPRIFPGFLNVGWQSVFTFDSGARLIEPIPNTGEDGVLVGDFDLDSGSPGWNLGSNGIVNSSHPDGSAYIARQSSNGRIGFDFIGDVYRVGAYVDGYGASGVSVAAYDAAGRLISAAQTWTVPVGDWDNNFVQVLSKVPIAKVVFTGNYLILDDLSFITNKPHIVTGTQREDTLNGSNPGSKSDGGDVMLGLGGVDKISGRGGPDLLDGANRNDTLKGGDGDDTLIGGRDADKLYGGADQDAFLFRTLDAVDKVKDFSPLEDTFILAKTGFTALALGPLQAGQLRIGAAAADGSDRIIYDPTTGKLSYDDDGVGGDPAVQFAKLSKGLAISEGDFTVA